MARTLGRYELVRPLAQGGMAEVFLARRRASSGVEKRVVLKRIRRERANDPRFVNLFVQEARLSMSLAHKNIVPVFDFGRAGDELFLAMEFVDGPDLGRVLEAARRRGERLDPMLVAYVVLEACQALDYAHSVRDEDGQVRALVHRDVTPRNVLISRAGEVKLVDFGVATSEAELESGKIRGTPAYMSPEQARGEALDGRSDVFSLGLVMWEGLSGRRPYDGRDQGQVLAQAREGKVPPLADDVPAALRKIVERATAASKEDRYRSSRQMQLALDEYLVAARAAAGGAPPSHVLAERLQEHPIEDAGSAAWDEEGPQGRVVTYLDDGADEVMAAVRDATQLSVAETVDEEAMQSMAGTAAEADEPGPGPGTAPGTTAHEDAETEAHPAGEAGHRAARPEAQGARMKLGPRSMWLVAAAALAATAVLSLVLRQGAGSEPARPDPGAQSSSALQSSIDQTDHEAAVAAGKSTDQRVAALEAAAMQQAGTEETPRPVDTAANDAVAPDGPARAAKQPDEAGKAAENGALNRRLRRPGTATRKSLPTDAAHRNPGGPGQVEAREPGVVQISATPWARVSVVGSSQTCEETPCTLTLPAGTHVLKLENPVANLRKERTVEVVSGQTVVVRETLTR